MRKRWDCGPTLHRHVTPRPMELDTMPKASPTYTLIVWQICNQHLHPSTYKQEDHSILEATVHRIFHAAQQDSHLQHMIDNITPEPILIHPTHCIQEWVSNSHHHFRAHQKAQQLCAKLHTEDICKFPLGEDNPNHQQQRIKNML